MNKIRHLEKQPQNNHKQKNKQKNNFTKDQLMMKWREFAFIIKEQNLHTLFTAMTAEDPKIDENFKIYFTVSNEVQLTFMQQKRNDIVAFLRTELRNDFIQLQTAEGSVANKQNLFTSKDKFNDMLKRNEHLEKFKKQFNLNLDI